MLLNCLVGLAYSGNLKGLLVLASDAIEAILHCLIVDAVVGQQTNSY